MATQKQDGQLEHTYNSYVMIRDVTLKTCRRRWMIGKRGERGSGISVLAAQHDDDDLTKMDIKIVPQPPYSPDLALCDFCLFPKFRGCCYETIEEMKEAVTKVNDTLTQEDFHGAFQKLLEWYKCITARGDYFERD